MPVIESLGMAVGSRTDEGKFFVLVLTATVTCAW